MRYNVRLATPIERTPRAKQLESLFDIPEAREAKLDLACECDLEARPWNIGLIVGPSGSGKSTMAREMFGDAAQVQYDWPASKSIVDGFAAGLSIRDITAALSATGFSSPPCWLKPFRVLSTGQKFRVNLARTLVDTRELVVVDEFTSVVDRTVARIGSCALSKEIRRRNRKFVAVSCHDDIMEWLQPDWILEPQLGRFSWRLLQRRPSIELSICRISHDTWPLFAPHHYMTGHLHKAAECYGAFIDRKQVAFDAWLPFVGRLRSGKKGRRGTRTVVLPDFQGVGIGRTLVDTVASMYVGLGYEALSRTAHPGEMASKMRNPNWRQTHYGFTGRDGGKLAKYSSTRTLTRRALSSIWVGAAMDAEQARRLHDAELT
jgi:GNAT superfamily N-acetyltransferase